MVGGGRAECLAHTDSFYTLDLIKLQDTYSEWTESMPHVKPFYAVKCNPEPRIVQALAELGSNFDCASPAEIQLVLDAGVESDRIIYANPCKGLQDIAFAKNMKIMRTTFDSVSELKKIARVWGNSEPRPELLLRIKADDPSARCNLGIKYGADEQDWDKLFLTASLLDLDVIGISFHVGSFASSSKVFAEAVKTATRAVDMAKEYGYKPHIIDIGGGFSHTHGLPKNLHSDIPMIAEPGRYFVEQVMTMYTPVIGIKGSSLTISESLYGAFNCILFDHAKPEIKKVIGRTGELVPMTIFGSTCDGGDIIYKQYNVPSDIQEGDWIVWENMGAYTSAATTRFNGIPFNERPIYVNPDLDQLLYLEPFSL